MPDIEAMDRWMDHLRNWVEDEIRDYMSGDQLLPGLVAGILLVVSSLYLSG